MRAKADSLKNLHQIVIDLIVLSNMYIRKYPDYAFSLTVDHTNLLATYDIFKIPDEQTKGR